MSSASRALRRRAQLWGLVLHRAGRAGDVQALPDVVCGLAPGFLGVSGATMTLHADTGDREIIAASDRLAVTADELQYVTGEGPSSAALAENRSVLVPELRDATDRWPGFVMLAREAGIAAMFTFPLSADASLQATFNLHRVRPGRLTDEELVDAYTLGTLAALALAHDHDHLLAQLLDGRGHYCPVYQATGILVGQLRVPAADASARLRAFAFACRRSPREVAQDIVAGRLQLDGPSG